MNPDGSEKAQLTDDGLSLAPSISPDGTKIVFAKVAEGSAIGGNSDAVDTVSTMSVDGTNRNDTDVDTQRIDGRSYLQWSKMGSKVASAKLLEDEERFIVFDINPDGTGYRESGVPFAGAGLLLDYSADDSKIVFWGPDEDAGGESYAAYSASADGSNRQKLNSGSAVHGITPLFSNTGEVYFTGLSADFSSSSLYSVDVDGNNQEVRHQYSELFTNLIKSPDDSVFAAIEERVSTINIFSPDGSNSEINLNIHDDLGLDYHFGGFNFSPDSSKIAFYARTDDESNHDIYTIDIDGTNLINVTNTPDENEFTTVNNQAWRVQNITSPTDADNDGTPGTTEDAAPNGGDANNDGTKDSLQSNVTSLIDPVSGNYAALAVSDTCTIESLSITAESANTTADSSYDYPNGMMDFNLDCGTPGFAADISQYYYKQDSKDLKLRKYNPATSAYATIDSASISTQSIAGQTVAKATYQVKDGSSLDLDNTVDGKIKDPSGLGAKTGDLAATGESQRTAIVTILIMMGLITLAFTANNALKQRAYTAAR